MARNGRSGRRGRQPGGFAQGPGGECWCPQCKTAVPHQIGVPCYNHQCPNCGQPMTRRI